MCICASVYVRFYSSLTNEKTSLWDFMWFMQNHRNSKWRKNTCTQVVLYVRCCFYCFSLRFSSVQSLSRVQLFATPWISARQASPSITNSRSSLRLKSIESVMPSSHLILCHTLLLLPPISPSIRVFSNESTLRMRWPKYGSSALASFLPKKSQGWSPSEWTGWISLQSKGL